MKGVFLIVFVLITLSRADEIPGASPLLKDPNLQAAVREALNKPAGVITKVDLASLEELNASLLGIKDLSGLEHAANLTNLNLSQNPFTDVSPLAGLTNLRRLLLYKNPISDIRSLSDLVNVEFVTFWSTNVKDLTPLRSRKKLKSIELRLTQVTDYSALHVLTNLELVATNHRLISEKQLSGLREAVPNCRMEIEKRITSSQKQSPTIRYDDD